MFSPTVPFKLSFYPVYPSNPQYLRTNKILWPRNGYFEENISRGLGLKRVLLFQSCLLSKIDVKSKVRLILTLRYSSPMLL